MLYQLSYTRVERKSSARYSWRWTVSGENAGRQTATYSAPLGSGEL